MQQLEADYNRLRKTLVEKLGWGNPSSWHSKMFQELSEQIFESTQVMLSVATLKRFFGVVRHEGSPGITTLDALCKFTGHESWTQFRMSEKTRGKRKFTLPAKSLYVSIGFILALVTIIIIGTDRPKYELNTSDFSFTSRVLSTDYPNSVVFDLTIPSELDTDSLIIQQYWDPTKTISIHKDQKQATGIYYYPGYYRAQLLLEGEQVSRHDLFLKSNGWLGTIEYDPIPKYFDPIMTENVLIQAPEYIFDEVEHREEMIVTSFSYVEDFGLLSADDFSLKTTINNQFDDRWAVCHRMAIYILAKNSAAIVPFSKIGCSSDNNLMLSDVYLSGKENDLSALNADFTEPVELGVALNNFKLRVSINGSDVYEKQYTEPLGDLAGIRIKFVGLGAVESLHLEDGLGKKVDLDQ